MTKFDTLVTLGAMVLAIGVVQVAVQSPPRSVHAWVLVGCIVLGWGLIYAARRTQRFH